MQININMLYITKYKTNKHNINMKQYIQEI